MKLKKNTVFMKNKVKQIFTIALVLIYTSTIAKENITGPGANTVVQTKIAAACAAATSQTDLNINNVRATILGGGDMWWDLNDAMYEIPKGSFKNSLFAGALWIGGVDAGGQLKVAAQTYRQGGDDFWPGPLNVNTATINDQECLAFNKHFKMEREMVEEFIARNQDPTYTIPDEILEWPAHGGPGQDPFLAPFFDVNADGFYNPYDGDYPDYNVTGTNKEAKLFGDQTLWWVFNDKGNIHTETGADPIGLEIHAQAFAFEADNEVNDMTFYNYKIINRATQSLNETYFGQWVDPDLGNYLDDYVGCDVGLGLGFCYNGDAEDEGATGYGFNPPAIGVDFFQGPLADPGDGLDNDRDGTIDELGEQIIMSKFVYFNNDGSMQGNPSTGSHFYNYLQGIWKDNVPMTYGGDGKGGGNGATNEPCNFMFPGSSDSSLFSQYGEWTEVTVGNTPADRRFIQSAGPFTLEPGAVNHITVGVIWARAQGGGPLASVELVKVYDQIAQALFDSNFDIINGPDAPDLNIRELDKELIFTISNSSTSNNINESYSEKDAFIQNPVNIPGNQDYNFQGYLVYQLLNSTVTQTDLDNPDKARLIFRSDIKDDVSAIINHYYTPAPANIWTPVEEVSGVLSAGMKGSVDNGIEYSFKITEDRFALGNTRLVNHKTYYYMALSYAYNEAEINEDPYADASTDPEYDGRNRPYLSGRRNIKVEKGIPHFTEPEDGGTVLNSSFGDGVKIQRLEGTGNGNIPLEFTDETITEILNSSSHRSFNPIYKNGLGPIDVSVVDPVAVKKGTYIFTLEDPILDNQNNISSYGKWVLKNETTGNVVATSTKPIEVGSEKLISDIGLTIKIQQGVNPAEDPALITNNGLITSSIEFENINDRWLTGVPDRDDESGMFWGLNWIRAGSFEVDAGGNTQLNDYFVNDDPNGIYESAVEKSTAVPFTNFLQLGNDFTMEYSGGTWAPYHLTSYYKDGPGFTQSSSQLASMADLHSVDIVFTDDKSKWSKCVVVEAQDDDLLTVGDQTKMGLRLTPSIDKDGNPTNDGTMGMSWFPGYAINLETGERLNIIFAEDSYLSEDNGRDLKWNPTSNIVTKEAPMYDPQTQTFSQGSYLLGGKHFIYVMGGSADVKKDSTYINGTESPNYDECAWIYNQLKEYTSPGYAANIWQVFRNATWVGVPLLSPGRSLLANDATVKLRVSKPYNQYVTRDASAILDKNDDLDTVTTYFVMGQNLTYNGNTYAPGDTFTTGSLITSFGGSSNARAISPIPVNGFSSMYRFSTDDIVAEKGDHNTAVNALDMINVVPNPYYAYSAYETSQLDNRIKITNLPTRATISIYTINGTLVRQMKKNDKMTSIDWDLKNTFGIPVSSGLYVIHIDAKGVGEKVLKWFGVMRPIDLDTF